MKFQKPKQFDSELLQYRLFNTVFYLKHKLTETICIKWPNISHVFRWGIRTEERERKEKNKGKNKGKNKKREEKKSVADVDFLNIN